MAETHRLTNPRKILVKDLNDSLTCSLCGGYLIDPTTVVDCSHTFCRACIVRHFESSRLCPNCGSLVHKNKPLTKLRSDTILQSVIYKVVPSLYTKELQRRADFYHSTGFRSNSACSDDSVLGDRNLDRDEWVMSNVGDPSLYFSPDDSISLSVEYYNPANVKLIDLPITEQKTSVKHENSPSENVTSDNKTTNSNSVSNISDNKIVLSETVKTDGQTLNNKNNSPNMDSDNKSVCDKSLSAVVGNDMTHKRFLQCPAAVRMSHLMKFLRMKFALSNEHRVDIIYDGEILPSYLSLMDVAYTFKWKREAPMRFFYLIYIPVAKPVVPQKPLPSKAPVTPPTIPPLKIEIPNSVKTETKNLTLELDNSKTKDTVSKITESPRKQIKIKTETPPDELNNAKEDNNNLKFNSSLKSIKFDKTSVHSAESKAHQKSVKFADKTHSYEYKVKNNDSLKTSNSDNCVYDYTEPDKEEIKAFAERRDREWALQKYQDSEIHVSKKRKKSKHSKNEFMHKKRKLHAEITSNEISSKPDDSLKLKVKLSVANGHKHKHRNNSSTTSSNNNNSSNSEPVKTQELSPKERLLQMRQVRHKHTVIANQNSDDKQPPKSEPVLKVILPQCTDKTPENTKTPVKNEPSSPKTSPETPLAQRPAENLFSTGKTLRSDFSFKTSLSKDICNKFVRINLEKCNEKNNVTKKTPVNVNAADKEKKDAKNDINSKTEIIPVIDNTKQSNNNKITLTSVNNKLSETKMLNNKPSIENNKTTVNNNNNNSNQIADKINNKIMENNKFVLKLNESKTDDSKNKVSDNLTITPKTPMENSKLSVVNNITNNNNSNSNNNNNSKVVENVLKSSTVKPTEQKQIDESKTIENKLNNITSQSSTLVTKNFTVSKIEAGVKRKLETPETSNDNRPSLEITLINYSRAPPSSVVQTSTVQTKPITNTQLTKSGVSITPEGPPAAKKNRPPPLTIPLGRIQKMNSLKAAAASQVQKPPEKCDIFGALDLSAKPNINAKIDVAKMANDFRTHTASPKLSIQEKIQSMIRPKTPIKPSQDLKTDPLNKNATTLEKLTRPNISNLQMLSESAVQIREMMSKGASPISGIPNLIKKLPTPQNSTALKTASEYLQKDPNFQIPKTSNFVTKTSNTTVNQIAKGLNTFTPKNPQFLSKSLQKLPKLNEINKSQFSRLNATQQIRTPRPAGQNQTIRNIPNPSLLVRQQNQNRINSLNNVMPQSQNHDVQKPDGTGAKLIKQTTISEIEPERKPEKTSEPPPLKPIESFKK